MMNNLHMNMFKNLRKTNYNNFYNNKYKLFNNKNKMIKITKMIKMINNKWSK